MAVPTAGFRLRRPRRQRIDLLAEVRKVLRRPRWQTQTGAFQGFGSPPGRF